MAEALSYDELDSVEIEGTTSGRSFSVVSDDGIERRGTIEMYSTGSASLDDEQASVVEIRQEFPEEDIFFDTREETSKAKIDFQIQVKRWLGSKGLGIEKPFAIEGDSN